MTQQERTEQLEDAITDVGIVLAGAMDAQDWDEVKKAFRMLGKVMPAEVCKRQGI